MTGKTRQIEIDEHTADVLDAAAVAQGMTIAQLLASWAQDVANDADDVAELDRRWARAQTDGAIPNDQVVGWLKTWGKVDFKPFAAK